MCMNHYGNKITDIVLLILYDGFNVPNRESQKKPCEYLSYLDHLELGIDQVLVAEQNAENWRM